MIYLDSDVMYVSVDNKMEDQAKFIVEEVCKAVQENGQFVIGQLKALFESKGKENEDDVPVVYTFSFIYDLKHLLSVSLCVFSYLLLIFDVELFLFQGNAFWI